MKFLTRFLTVMLVLFAVACASSPAARIQEKIAEYHALTPAQQQAIAAGVIEVGDTPDMVYMALGSPTIKEPTTAGGLALEKWTYRNYYPSESLSGDSIYRRPTMKSGPHQSSALAAWGNATLPSDPSARGDTIDTPSHGPSIGGGSGAPDVAPMKLQVWFHKGRVAAFKLDR
jgi:hypothetical protein